MSNARLVLDTNIVSYLMRGGTEAELYAPLLENRLLAITFITVGELYYGAEKGNWGEKRRKALETQLRNFVVIPYDHEIARSYGRIQADLTRNGTQICVNDAWIAACAVRHATPLVTHNHKHFKHVADLDVITREVEK
jgi:predicted nucleic acid-binding protein